MEANQYTVGTDTARTTLPVPPLYHKGAVNNNQSHGPSMIHRGNDTGSVHSRSASERSASTRGSSTQGSSHEDDDNNCGTSFSTGGKRHSQVLPAQRNRHARRLYVGCIPPSFNAENDLRDFFNDVIARGLGVENDGSFVLSIYINNKNNFAFVELASIELTVACLDLDGIVYKDETALHVVRANEYKPDLVPEALRQKLLKFDLSFCRFGGPDKLPPQPLLSPPKSHDGISNISSMYADDDCCSGDDCDTGKPSHSPRPGSPPSAMSSIDSIIEKADLSSITEGAVVLLGFPFDQKNSFDTFRDNDMDDSNSRASAPAVNRGAQTSATVPDIFREMLYSYKRLLIRNPEFQVDLSNVRVMDVGNVVAGETAEATQVNLAMTVSSILRRGGIPFIVGGTAEKLHYISYGAMDAVNNEKVGIINVSGILNATLLFSSLFCDATVDAVSGPRTYVPRSSASTAASASAAPSRTALPSTGGNGNEKNIHSNSKCPLKRTKQSKKLETLSCSGRYVQFGAQGNMSSADDATILENGCAKTIWLTKHLHNDDQTSIQQHMREALSSLSLRHPLNKAHTYTHTSSSRAATNERADEEEDGAAGAGATAEKCAEVPANSNSASSTGSNESSIANDTAESAATYSTTTTHTTAATVGSNSNSKSNGQERVISNTYTKTSLGSSSASSCSSSSSSSSASSLSSSSSSSSADDSSGSDSNATTTRTTHSSLKLHIAMTLSGSCMMARERPKGIGSLGGFSGFTAKEVFDIARTAGRDSNVVLMDLTDFKCSGLALNPSLCSSSPSAAAAAAAADCNDLVLVEIFYHFLVGFSDRSEGLPYKPLGVAAAVAQGGHHHPTVAHPPLPVETNLNPPLWHSSSSSNHTQLHSHTQLSIHTTNISSSDYSRTSSSDKVCQGEEGRTQRGQKNSSSSSSSYSSSSFIFNTDTGCSSSSECSGCDYSSTSSGRRETLTSSTSSTSAAGPGVTAAHIPAAAAAQMHEFYQQQQAGSVVASTGSTAHTNVTAASQLDDTNNTILVEQNDLLLHLGLNNNNNNNNNSNNSPNTEDIHGSASLALEPLPPSIFDQMEHRLQHHYHSNDNDNQQSKNDFPLDTHNYVYIRGSGRANGNGKGDTTDDNGDVNATQKHYATETFHAFDFPSTGSYPAREDERHFAASSTLARGGSRSKAETQSLSSSSFDSLLLPAAAAADHLSAVPDLLYDSLLNFQQQQQQQGTASIETIGLLGRRDEGGRGGTGLVERKKSAGGGGGGGSVGGGGTRGDTATNPIFTQQPPQYGFGTGTVSAPPLFGALDTSPASSLHHQFDSSAQTAAAAALPHFALLSPTTAAPSTTTQQYEQQQPHDETHHMFHAGKKIVPFAMSVQQQMQQHHLNSGGATVAKRIHYSTSSMSGEGLGGGNTEIEVYPQVPTTVPPPPAAAAVASETAVDVATGMYVGDVAATAANKAAPYVISASTRVVPVGITPSGPPTGAYVNTSASSSSSRYQYLQPQQIHPPPPPHHQQQHHQQHRQQRYYSPHEQGLGSGSSVVGDRSTSTTHSHNSSKSDTMDYYRSGGGPYGGPYPPSYEEEAAAGTVETATTVQQQQQRQLDPMSAGAGREEYSNMTLLGYDTPEQIAAREAAFQRARQIQQQQQKYQRYKQRHYQQHQQQQLLHQQRQQQQQPYGWN